MGTSLDRFADRKPGWDTPLVIESLLNGARTKAMNPHTPVTTDEIVEDAIACRDAGACVIHARNTSFDLTGQAAADDDMPAWSRILKARPDMTLYPTACNPARCAADEHCAILARTANVRIVCIDPGINLFARTLDGHGHILGQEYGWNHRQVAGQVDLAGPQNEHRPGHLRAGPAQARPARRPPRHGNAGLVPELLPHRSAACPTCRSAGSRSARSRARPARLDADRCARSRACAEDRLFRQVARRRLTAKGMARRRISDDLSSRDVRKNAKRMPRPHASPSR